LKVGPDKAASAVQVSQPLLGELGLELALLGGAKGLP
jgi:hypothetical protein